MSVRKRLIVGKVVLEKPRRGYLLCERYRYFIVMAVMMALMLPCVANESVHLAAKTALESMTGKNLAKLYKARTEADNSNQREVIVQACIAGLYAIGDSKNAKKISQGVNSAEFVESFMRECDLCYGGGSSQEGCYKCNGSGACQNRKCNNGIVISEGFDGRSNARKCSNCGGSGRCVNCKGTGKIVRPCSRCNGAKKVIHKAIALASCKDMLNALIACGNEIQCRKKAEGTSRLAQQKVENEKRAREKVEENVRHAQSKAEGGNNVRGGAVVVPDNAKGSGRTKVVLPADEDSLKSAFPNSYKKIESVVIQDGVTSIENSAFEDCSSLRSVIIPKGVTSIGSQAFKGCSGLTSVVIPDSVTHIYSAAFEGCTGLTSVVIPDSVTYFDDRAFGDCNGLTKVVIGKNVRSIGSDLFKGCSAVTSVTMPTRMQLSSSFPDAYKTIQSVVIQDGGTSIENMAFRGCSGLTNVTIPDSVTEIGYSAFEDCAGLTSVVIPDSVTRIYHSAFKGCTGLTSVTIPDRVTNIDIGTFGDCSGLTNVVIGKNVTKAYSAFKGCSRVTSVTMPACMRLSLITDAYKTIQSVVIQDGGTSIVNDAFEGCTGLTNVTIPKGVSRVGNKAFEGCTGLTNVTIPKGVTSIGSNAFSGCSGLTSVTIPDSVTSIGYGAFRSCTGLTSAVIPNSVTSIDSYAFSGCSALTSVTLPQSLKKLGSDAFEHCEKIEFFGNKEFKGEDISDRALAGTQYTVIDIGGVKCIRRIKDAVQIAQNAEFEKNLANIASARECFGDGCQITANWLQVAVLKRKSGGFNYKVSGECNGVSNTRLYYRRQGWTQTEDVDWSYDLSYLVLSDEREWMNWMEALKAVRAKVIEWVDVAAKNGIDKVEREIPIGGIEVLAHSNMITKGNGQRELYLAAIRKFEKPSTPVKFFCEMWVKDNGKGEYNGSITARCGYFEQEILSFSGDKSSINNDILLLIERYNPEALKKAYLEYEKKQDLFK